LNNGSFVLRGTL